MKLSLLFSKIEQSPLGMSSSDHNIYIYCDVQSANISLESPQNYQHSNDSGRLEWKKCEENIKNSPMYLGRVCAEVHGQREATLE